MEAVTFSAYNFGGYPPCFPLYPGNGKLRPQSWSRKPGGLGLLPEVAAGYFDVVKRAQLKAALSQVNPTLTPRLRRADTRDRGVQVSPKVSVTVQCSLGPRTLHSPGPGKNQGQNQGWDSPKNSASQRQSLPSTPVNTVRFSRPVAIYSPVFERRFFPVVSRAEGGRGGRQQQRVPSGEGAEEPEEASSLSLQSPEQQACSLSRRSTTAFNFQFLEQKYGYYHCGKCSIRWESAYVWCISGTCKVYFKQHCRRCQIGLNPYRVESIQCQVCAQTRCCCDRKQRHINLRRPHRQDLCGRCKGKRLSCDTTYSFKYIV